MTSKTSKGYAELCEVWLYGIDKQSENNQPNYA